jgi:hypothetical protein
MITQMQEGRQIPRRNSVGDLREGDQKTTKPPVQRKNVTDKVIDALTSTDVLDKIMPVLTQTITETIVSVIESSSLVILSDCSVNCLECPSITSCCSLMVIC